MSQDAFSEMERAAIYRVIAERRDVRDHFTAEPVGDDVLLRVLGAAHKAPSVGLSQPWRFLVIRKSETRAAVHALFESASAEAAQTYAGERAERYRALRLAGILDAPVNLCVLSDDDPIRGAGLGRRTMPETARYSTVCAIQNLWLAARAEGLGVGWVSIVDPAALRRTLKVPPQLALVAYLCVGFTRGFATEPDLERAHWDVRVPLADVIAYERFGD